MTTPAYKTSPIKSMATQNGDIKVLINMIPLRFSLTLRGSYSLRVGLFSICKNVLKANWTIYLFHVVFEQAFLWLLVILYSWFVNIQIGIFQYWKFANIWLNKIELLVVIMTNEFFSRLHRSHFYNDDVRILVWPLQNSQVHNIFCEVWSFRRNEISELAYWYMNRYICTAEVLRIHLLELMKL